MMGDTTTFTFGSHSVRITGQNGGHWFVLRDLLGAMESSTKPSDAVDAIEQCLGDGFVAGAPILDSLGRLQTVVIVSDAAATFLLSRSNTEAGRALNRHIHVEVLPSIRRTGAYVSPLHEPPLHAVKDLLMVGEAMTKIPGANEAHVMMCMLEAIEHVTGLPTSMLVKALPAVQQQPKRPPGPRRPRIAAAFGEIFPSVRAALQKHGTPGLTPEAVRGRLNAGLSMEDALTRPLRGKTSRAVDYFNWHSDPRSRAQVCADAVARFDEETPACPDLMTH